MGQPVPEDVLCTHEHDLEREDERCVRAREAGIDTEHVKNYVATLTDRGLQRRLRDPSRNVSFSKAAYQAKDTLLLSSDDLVLEVQKASSGAYALSFWFVNQESRRMRAEESARLYNLSRSRAIDLSRHREPHLLATEFLHILRDVINFYLG